MKDEKTERAKGATAIASIELSPAQAGLGFFVLDVPGVPLRSTPGFMLSPASRATPFVF